MVLYQYLLTLDVIILLHLNLAALVPVILIRQQFDLRLLTRLEIQQRPLLQLLLEFLKDDLFFRLRNRELVLFLHGQVRQCRTAIFVILWGNKVIDLLVF